MKKKITCLVTAVVITATISATAYAATFGGGNSYSKSLSFTSAWTTTSLAGGYSGTASVAGTAYFCNETWAFDVQAVPFSSSNQASAGGVCASCSISHDSFHTYGYAASASHSGSATFFGGSPTYTYQENSVY
jgi:hypothetical protein